MTEVLPTCKEASFEQRRINVQEKRKNATAVALPLLSDGKHLASLEDSAAFVEF